MIVCGVLKQGVLLNTADLFRESQKHFAWCSAGLQSPAAGQPADCSHSNPALDPPQALAAFSLITIL